MTWKPPLNLEVFAKRLLADSPRHTARAYLRVLRRAVEAGDPQAPLNEAQSVSSWTVARSALRRYAAYAEIDPDVLVGNARKHGKAGRIRNEAPEAAWTAIVAEAQKLDEPLRDVILLVLLAGLRIGGTLAITREQATRLAAGESGVEIAEKRGSRRWSPDVDVRGFLGSLLRYAGWERVGDVLAKNPDTAQIRAREVIASLCTRAGVPYYTPHQYRHSLATYMMEDDTDIRTVQEALGHKDIRTTARYQHPSSERQMRARGSVVRRILGK